MRIVPTLLLLIVFLPACLPRETSEATCVGVADGDTIVVEINQREVRIRLEGVDAPERGQAFSQRSRQLTRKLVLGRVVMVDQRDVDQYGRVVARVSVEGMDVSVALVKAGLAWHYRRYSSDPILMAAEASARKAGIGIWSHPAPVPPWEYRRGVREGSFYRPSGPRLSADHVARAQEEGPSIYRDPPLNR